MQKNVASQKWVVFAFDETNNTAKTGDAANITANLRIDGGTANAVDDTNPTELEDGYYIFDITQAESNGDYILICPASSTANIQVIGVPGAVWTTAANYNAHSIDSNGRIDVIKVAGTTQTANDNGADIDAILVDTNELQTDWVNGGRLDLIIDAILADTGTDGVALADGVITAAKLGADCITNAKIADDAIAAENLATNAIATDAVAATALDKVVMSDIAAGAPSATASIVTAINYLYEAWRNKTTTTSTTITLMKDDGSTTLVTSTISDDGTTFTKGEMS